MQLQLPYRDLFASPSLRVSLYQDDLDHPGVHSLDCPNCPCPGCATCVAGSRVVTTAEKIAPSLRISHQEERHSDPPLDRNTKVCIIGAGIAGLYIALILQDLGIPNLSWDILEANRERIGGRIYTHRFSDAPNDYYDVGAMRYPDIPIMSRVFDLFRRMEVPLKEYHMREIKTNKGDVGSSKGECPSTTLLNQAFGPYKKIMQRNFVHGFQLLMQTDAMSTREYLRVNHKSDLMAVQTAESLTTGTGAFDQAFSESVMDSFDFEGLTESEQCLTGVKWYSVAGGSSVVIDRMCQQIKSSSTVETGKQVRRIAVDCSGDLSVSCKGEAEARDGYATVFSTVPLGCLQRIDTGSLHLDPIQKEAIRCLRYDDSTKVGIKFAYPWWIVDCGMRGGGSATTTLPSRKCVYPSHISAEDWDKPAVLLASYTWGQDASRMGALIGPSSTASSDDGEDGGDDLLDLVLHDLAEQHQQHGITYEKLRALYRDHHAFCWGNSRFSSGGFALFAPGQFTNLYPSLSLPAADGKFHIVGEAASIHHGWVVGSLNSAYVAVYRFLRRYGQHRAIRKLEKNWGNVHELDLAGVSCF
ncbi:Amine oxidase [Penicillium paradoxum]|uniref:Amine oxidase n=1 Tax=Penicillium paradoxum TaxID=176176 RepID=UPI00254872BD|nr:Amine oxidase [Penicillium paradoxum]KAJ5780654.1 Amine oxidase [Penicillium paradoxum]